ncbi:peptidoglycan-binding protein [Streptomyces sp. NPDC016562]|uniref:peptidoglycan-binding domain-containing protein n=1 Tax=Streptomyces sp. NPDC016562 TaxID=3364966 RepID=UPI0036F9C91D
MGFNPLRIRPYVTLPDPGEPDEPAPPPSISSVVTPAPHPTAAQNDTPPYGTPVPPPPGPWQDGPWQAGPWQATPEHPSSPPGSTTETTELHSIPHAAHPHGGATQVGGGMGTIAVGDATAITDTNGTANGSDTGNGTGTGTGTGTGNGNGNANWGEGGGGGGGGGPEKRTGGRPASRRPLALLIAAAAVVALSGTAVAVWVLPSSAGSDSALRDAKASAPAVSAAPTAPTASPTPGSASPSASPSPSPSKSASPSPSPSPSRSSAPPSPSPSPSASRSASPSAPPAASGPTLRYGDSGPEVQKLQQLLTARGLYDGKINGKYDWRVENAVSTFQYNNDIDEEWGVYGPITRRALEG